MPDQGKKWKAIADVLAGRDLLEQEGREAGEDATESRADARMRRRFRGGVLAATAVTALVAGAGVASLSGASATSGPASRQSDGATVQPPSGHAPYSGYVGGHDTIEADKHPRLVAAIDCHDPRATGERLEELGYAVKWELVEDRVGERSETSPTVASPVTEPPADASIMSVSGPGYAAVTDKTEEVLIEVAPADSAILDSHADLADCQ